MVGITWVLFVGPGAGNNGISWCCWRSLYYDEWHINCARCECNTALNWSIDTSLSTSLISLFDWTSSNFCAKKFITQLYSRAVTSTCKKFHRCYLCIQILLDSCSRSLKALLYKCTYVYSTTRTSVTTCVVDLCIFLVYYAPRHIYTHTLTHTHTHTHTHTPTPTHISLRQPGSQLERDAPFLT